MELANKIQDLSRYEINMNAKGTTTLKDKSGRTISDYLNEDTLKKKMEIELFRNAFLGGGGYGSVFKGKLGNRQVAVKRVELHHVNSKEEALMLQLDHTNIVKLLLCESDDNFR